MRKSFELQGLSNRWTEGSLKRTAPLTLLLTVHKRDTLRDQLAAIQSQTLRPEEVVVFQNGEFFDVTDVVPSEYNLVQNRKNTKFFGRFAFLLGADTEYVAVMDDDILPGPNFLENYFEQVIADDIILGANGRFASDGVRSLFRKCPPDFGIRESQTVVDFVGHFWIFRKVHLYSMFSIPPYTFETGEDMHLCFSAKLKTGVPSVVARQVDESEQCDLWSNARADDSFSSFRHTARSQRLAVERYFRKMGLEFV